MPDAATQNAAEATIRAMADKYKDAYRETATDILGRHITRLAGDEVVLEEPALLLLALRRAGHITSAEATRLHGDYLRAKDKSGAGCAYGLQIKSGFENG